MFKIIHSCYSYVRDLWKHLIFELYWNVNKQNKKFLKFFVPAPLGPKSKLRRRAWTRNVSSFLAKRDIIKRLGACDLMHEFENRALKVRKSQKNFFFSSISPKNKQKLFLPYPLKVVESILFISQLYVPFRPVLTCPI